MSGHFSIRIEYYIVSRKINHYTTIIDSYRQLQVEDSVEEEDPLLTSVKSRKTLKKRV